jgi:hypothetical protein
MSRKEATLDELLATFSNHIREAYPSAEAFRDNLSALLDDKRSRMSDGEYAVALERNIVYLNDLVTEGESYIDMLLRLDEPDGADGERINEMFSRLEENVRRGMEKRHREVFIEGNDGAFAELVELRKNGGERYLARLEFNYRYLMTLRLLLFEFFNVLINVKAAYIVKRLGPADGGAIMNHIVFTANFFLGNIHVEEKADGSNKVN